MLGLNLFSTNRTDNDCFVLRNTHALELLKNVTAVSMMCMEAVPKTCSEAIRDEDQPRTLGLNPSLT